MAVETKVGSTEVEPVALVAGAIRGIGLAVAVDLAKAGVRLVVTYYDWLDDLDGMRQSLAETGVDFIAVPVDLRDEAGAEKAVSAAMDGFGRLDILVNNVERGGWPIVHGPYTRHQWDLEFDTTVLAKWNLFTAALPYLRESGGGCVVNISSIAAHVGRSGPAGLVFNDGYSAANRAVGSLTRQWAREAAPEVRVNELMLGFFETRHGPSTRGWGLLSQRQRDAILEHTLLGRTGKLEDVARAVRFMVFDAPFMTGATLVLDGGYMLGGEPVPDMPPGVVPPDAPTFGGSKPPEGI